MAPGTQGTSERNSLMAEAMKTMQSELQNRANMEPLRLPAKAVLEQSKRLPDDLLERYKDAYEGYAAFIRKCSAGEADPTQKEVDIRTATILEDAAAKIGAELQLRKSVAEVVAPDEPPVAEPPIKRGPGRPRKDEQLNA